MKEKFLGHFARSIDGKKIAILAEYREKLEREVVIGGFYPEGCLFLCSPEEWERIKARIELLFEASVRREIRMMVISATEIEMDEEGGIKIPEHLREYAHLNKKAILVGCGSYIEMWNPERWEIEQKRILSTVKALYEKELTGKEERWKQLSGRSPMA